MNHQDTKSTKDSPELELPDHRDATAHHIIGAAIEVHRLLVPGFLESVYEEALCVELGLRDVPFSRQVPIDITYKGRNIGSGRVDLLVGGCVVVELKATDTIAPIHVAQVLSYLKATRLRLALLITFNVPLLRTGIKRIAL
jgi:GxxExxY protein